MTDRTVWDEFITMAGMGHRGWANYKARKTTAKQCTAEHERVHAFKEKTKSNSWLIDGTQQPAKQTSVTHRQIQLHKIPGTTQGLGFEIHCTNLG